MGADPRFPACLGGFESIRRHWNEKEQITVAKVLPGEYYVTLSDEQIVTVLGSCIAVCIRDKVHRIGGMNHFMLPVISHERLRNESASIIGSATRYGNYAMEHLINAIMKHGGQRRNLEVKVFGGGKIIQSMTDIGEKNIEFVFHYLATEGMRVSAQDVGDIYPRKVLFYPASGRVRVKKIRDSHAQLVLNQELVYRNSIKDMKVEGEIELF
jgi:chemotaxis protein CheD